MACRPDLLFSHLLVDLYSQERSASQRIAVEALEHSLLKKWCPEDQVTPLQESLALEKFLASNSRCKSWVLSPESLVDDELISLFREEWNGFCNVNKKTGWGVAPLDLSPHRAIGYGRMGPGKSAGVRDLSFYAKAFAGHLTTYDQHLYQLYRAVIAVDDRWAEAERLRSQRFGVPRVIAGNKVSVVPKNVDVGRTIASEASLNMFIQLGQGRLLEDRLASYFGLNIRGGKGSVQHSKNQELARLGSIRGDYATLDLSSASDSISLAMLKEFTPPEVLWGLLRTRASHSTLPNGSRVELGMVSSMGNGYTFPLETAIFATAVHAVFRFCGMEYKGPHGRRLGNHAVFGDDIIVPTKLYRPLVRLLNLLGFIVNNDKSFSEGPFRESCGADFHAGYPVRGVYLRELDPIESRFVAYNSLKAWASLHKLRINRTLGYIVKSLPPEDRHWVPPWENPEAGLRSFEPRDRIRRIVVKDPDKKIGTHTVDGFSYRRLEPIARRVSVEVGNWPEGLFFNPTGILLCFLGGYVRDGHLVFTVEKQRYRVRTCVTPNWEVGPNTLGWQSP